MNGKNPSLIRIRITSTRRGMKMVPMPEPGRITVVPPPMAMAVPRMPVLIAVGPEKAAPVPPVEPVLPEPPEIATGLDVAVDEALPVLPVFVALDCDETLPELPDVA